MKENLGDLRRSLRECQERLFKLRFQRVLGSVEKVSLFREERAQRARIMSKVVRGEDA